ncbi:alpha/beta fold hydrolase [Nocardioides sp. GY 10113]|uniref:alpha/beta fold hydrolase n=1 Tax=Nocardioides sp. GY 10113 TaxID=2569761 RepID=UPI0010A8D566|nr:alpha/beta fold hydrolase [Nocardioides sp. GY 10113]TIC86326.1 alpha/beta fold hydrolase [Nocardioides sp. GY 10113]
MTPEHIASEELLAPLPGGVELCYQTFGDPTDEPLLLVMGLGGPMTWWDTALCQQLAGLGFYVIRYDNRDTGRSSRIPGRVAPHQLTQAFLTGRARAPYSMADLTEDASGLLDHLGIGSAHVAGVSMGGMIAQTLAVGAPDRVRSLASIMSTTGRRGVGLPHPSLLPMLAARRRGGREEYIATSQRVWSAISSPGYPTDPARLVERAGLTYDRGFTPDGVLRQMLAILTQPDRTAALRTLRTPTLVLHGMADRMVHVSGGRATAAAIRGSELVLVAGMGHDLPPALFGTFASAIRRNADRAALRRAR